MLKKQDIAERNRELLEENSAMLKTIKKGSEVAYLIKDMSQTMKRALELVENELAVFGEVSDLFESSKDLTDSVKSMAEIIIDTYEFDWKYNVNPDYFLPEIPDYGKDV